MQSKFTMNMFGPNRDIIVLESTEYEGVIEHSHEFLEVVYVTGGEMEHLIRGQRIPLKKGDVFALTQSDVHTLAPVGKGTHRWLNCLISRSFAGNAYDEIDPCAVISASSRFDIAYLLDALYNEYTQQMPRYQDIMRGYAISLLNLILRDQQVKAYTTQMSSAARKDEYVNKAVEFIQKNSSKKLDLKEIADAVGISAGYLDRLFRERSTTPIDYLNLRRIIHACRLLISDDKPVAEICNEVGFNDIKFFYILFKRQNSMAPGQYRKTYRRVEGKG